MQPPVLMREGQEGWVWLELEIVGSAKECRHTALFLVMNDNCVEGGTTASIAQWEYTLLNSPKRGSESDTGGK